MNNYRDISTLNRQIRPYTRYELNTVMRGLALTILHISSHQRRHSNQKSVHQEGWTLRSTKNSYKYNTLHFNSLQEIINAACVSAFWTGCRNCTQICLKRAVSSVVTHSLLLKTLPHAHAIPRNTAHHRGFQSHPSCTKAGLNACQMIQKGPRWGSWQLLYISLFPLGPGMLLIIICIAIFFLHPPPAVP